MTKRKKSECTTNTRRINPDKLFFNEICINTAIVQRSWFNKTDIITVYNRRFYPSIKLKQAHKLLTSETIY
uniref:Uncharacterized protein n=1 Tax=mine drainage metagenome TaxID=410659 RepID=E6QQQ0_9ZZZZ